MKGIRCSGCLLYWKDHGEWCPIAHRIIGSLNTPRTCPAWEPIPMPSHGNVVQEPPLKRLANGQEYPQPDFMGNERVLIH